MDWPLRKSAGSHTQEVRMLSLLARATLLYSLKLNTHIIHILLIYWYVDLGISQVHTAVQNDKYV